MQKCPTTVRQAATWIFSAILALAVLGGLGQLGSVPALAAPADVGFRDFSYGSATSSPTGNKAQNKLWFNDGSWWGSLFNPSVTDYQIYRFNRTNHTWSSTSTRIDSRNNSKADTLWDGTHLYVASAVVSTTGSDQAANVMRYSYDPSADRYTLDAGFPVTVGSGPMEALTLDKDSTGKLWVTFTQNNRLFVNRSLGSETSWGQPFVPSVAGVNLDPDDVSAVAAYNLNTAAPKMGLMWSNQADDKIYFSAHTDGAPDNAWQTTRTVIEGPRSADDHVNLKSLQTDPEGRIFTVHKTSFGDSGSPDPNAPLIYVTVLRQDGTFTRHVFGRVADDHTRPTLMIDEENQNLYVFASAPVSPGGTIYYKKAPLGTPDFPNGRGTPFIKSSTDTTINNVTSTKQNATSASGILVLASDDTSNFYLHNTIDTEADTTAPRITLRTPPNGATYPLRRSVKAAYTCADSGSGMKSCVGTVPNGAAINTRTPGGKTFTVRATDKAGNTSSTTHRYTVTRSSGRQACTITGTAGNNRLTGTPRRDVICGFGGNDTLKGFAGRDALMGGPGNDALRGGAGTDTLRGRSGADRHFGEAGPDLLRSKDGTNGNDTLGGGTGIDRCSTDATEASIAGCP